MLRASIFTLIALFLIIGCDDDSNPVTPDQPSIYTIQLTGLPESVSSPHGVNHDIDFQITVINKATNEVVTGASVNLAVPTGSGTITPAFSTTNANGMVEAEYSFEMASGKSSVTIFFTADNQSTTATINLLGTARPYALSLTPRDTTLYTEYGEDVAFDLTVAVTDEYQMGIAGTRIQFEVGVNPDFPQDTLFGSLTRIVETDRDGIAKTTFRTLGGAGNLTFKCSVDEGEEFRDIMVEMDLAVFQEPLSERGNLILNSDVDYIYADLGVTRARVRAVLKDSQNREIVGREIVFTSNNNSAISSPNVTDSLGIAYATFSDVGLPSMNAVGERVPCVVHAIYRPLDLDVSLTIDIRPSENVDNIVLVAGELIMLAGSGVSTWIRATCYLDEARTVLAPYGTLVNFQVSEGM